MLLGDVRHFVLQPGQRQLTVMKDGFLLLLVAGHGEDLLRGHIPKLLVHNNGGGNYFRQRANDLLRFKAAFTLLTSRV
ncbi:MAG: hypothetical protein KBT88_05630 [Gammaproteobacteria bacterium]|nr:hypothetical protein [Gammaproteobacteria bacterium]MBQ0839249.1 hypothetical protein [Gammaproteobacteria bacterium]